MIVVTGATGQLGRLVVRDLLEKVPAERIVAAVRSPEKAGEFAAVGVDVRRADYDDPASLESAFAGAEKILLISGSEVGRRIAQHTATVEAAARSGARLLAYTSVLHADTTPLVLAPEHKATEDVIRGAGIPYTFLRNGWYTEVYADTITQAARTGSFIGSANAGRVASATRQDYAEAAVAVLTGEGHENKAYELSGDHAWSFPELAAEIATAAGRPVNYHNLSPERHRATLLEAGLPEPVADLLVGIDAGVSAGLLAATPGELRTLIGRPTTPLAETVRELLGGPDR
ncbi:SDR family oxidoreductase [Actinopolymorpha alba]|uniref:SDR family oxidoreductase n=1 Tax=Actinopolymorpha alba TaxID=533267 RepID=UPI0003671248|nr:SDR family oxidoreductase [Actinopolymorpha alba]